MTEIGNNYLLGSGHFSAKQSSVEPPVHCLPPWNANTMTRLFLTPSPHFELQGLHLPHSQSTGKKGEKKVQICT